MTGLLDRLRQASGAVARRAASVHIHEDRIPDYARSLTPVPGSPDPQPEALGGGSEEHAAFWLTLDAINFGSGWFPTLRKREGQSGYHTIAAGIRERFTRHGAWSAAKLSTIDTAELADVLGQGPDHELISLYIRSLHALGARIAADHDGSFISVIEQSAPSAQRLVELLAGWDCFADVSRYGDLELPFLKRAQITAADLARAGVAKFNDLSALTMFADNLVPHVLRVDGVLEYDPALLERIERGELLEHGSAEEVEIRACALHAVELIVGAGGDTCAAVVDQLLWERGAQPRYKALPRHRSRCTAY